SATEEEAFERLEQLLAPERLDLAAEAVVLGDDHVVLERDVRGLDAVVELVTDEHVVLLVPLRGGAEVLVDRPAHGPHGAGAALDPDHDPLGASGVVPSIQDALDIDTSRVGGLHDVEYTNRGSEARA